MLKNHVASKLMLALSLILMILTFGCMPVQTRVTPFFVNNIDF